MLRRVISGGQVGADRGGLDWAIGAGLEIGGWCPKGRMAEDGAIPSIYPLRETSQRSYPDRTRKNVAEADATVIFSKMPMGRGSALTERYCQKLGKPYLVVTDTDTITAAAGKLVAMLRQHGVTVLNVAGGRDPYYYKLARTILDAAWKLLSQPSDSPAQPKAKPGDPKTFLLGRRAHLGTVETENGHQIVRFKDYTGMGCHVRDTALGSDKPVIGIGIADLGDIMLDKDGAARLAAALTHWVNHTDLSLA